MHNYAHVPSSDLEIGSPPPREETPPKDFDPPPKGADDDNEVSGEEAADLVVDHLAMAFALERASKQRSLLGEGIIIAVKFCKDVRDQTFTKKDVIRIENTLKGFQRRSAQAQMDAVSEFHGNVFIPGLLLTL